MAFLNILAAGIADGIKVPNGFPWDMLIMKVFGFIADYGWRILVFTIILKLVLSPLDIYQRFAMRKNQKITERMAPQLEKLKKVYGGDKTVLAQKQMELNKKEGFSYFSSCLPMILTLVIFFSLFSSLNYISNYMNMKQYVELYDVYNAKYTEVVDDKVQSEIDKLGESIVVQVATLRQEIKDIQLEVDTLQKEIAAMNLEVAPKQAKIDELNKKIETLNEEITKLKKKADKNKVEIEKKEAEVIAIQQEIVPIQVEVDAKKAEIDIVATAAKVKQDIITAKNGVIVQIAGAEIKLGEEKSTVTAQEAVFDSYNNEKKQSFLWVKNIWSADVPWTKPIKEYNAFKTAVGSFGNKKNAMKKLGVNDVVFDDLMSNPKYNIVTEKLRNDSSNKTNGLLILVIMSVGLSFLSQFITQRQQKKSGQAAMGGGMGGSMKFIMILMPLMMGFFALTYSTAFTLYIVVNSAMTILINLATTGIMKLVDSGKEPKNKSGVKKYGRPDPNDKSGK